MLYHTFPHHFSSFLCEIAYSNERPQDSDVIKAKKKCWPLYRVLMKNGDDVWLNPQQSHLFTAVTDFSISKVVHNSQQQLVILFPSSNHTNHEIEHRFQILNEIGVKFNDIFL